MFSRDAKLYLAHGVLVSLAWGITSVLFNLYLLEAGLSKESVGVFLSAAMFVTAALALLAGAIADRMSRRTIILLGGIVSLATAAVQYSFIDLSILIVSQLFAGTASAFSSVSWNSYASDLSSDQERAHLFGIGSGLSMLAFLAGNLSGGFLPNIISTLLTSADIVLLYRCSLWVSIVPEGLGIAMVYLMAPDRSLQHRTPHPRRMIRPLSNVRHWRLILSYATTVSIIGFGAGMIVMFFNIFFKEVYDLSPELIGTVFALNTLVLASGNLVAPALSDRLGKVKTVVLTEALSIPFLVMLSLDTPVYWAICAFVMRNVMMNMAGPVSTAFLMENLSRDERATATGIVTTGDQAVRGIAAIIAAQLLEAGRYREPYLIAAMLYVVAIILFYALFRDIEAKSLELKRASVDLKQVPDIEAT
ncbi:MAG: MFS transporter [Candidatus Thorarchaeota archaeon]